MLLKWDEDGSRYYETGTKKVVLYNTKDTTDDGKSYTNGVAWNGVSAITDSPSGADETKIYADDIKYASMRATEDYGGTIEAYQSPKEFNICDGSANYGGGLSVNMQKRHSFGLSYVTQVGNDLDDAAGYKIHLVYNATVSPSSKSYATINESPEAITLSWEFTTNPISFAEDGKYASLKPTSSLVIDTTKLSEAVVKAGVLAKLEEALYGTAETEPYLPTPDAVVAMFDVTE
jgi:hypothetical protein